MAKVKKEKVSGNKAEKKENTVFPIILGVLFVAVLAGVIIFLSIYSEKNKKAPVVATKVTEGDGEIIDYEKNGMVKLADYSKLEIEKEKDDTDEDLKNSNWDAYLEKCTVNDYPDGFLEEAISDTQKQYEGFAEVSGMTYDELLESYGMDENTVNEVAADTVNARMIAKTIASKENLKLTDKMKEDYLMALMSYEEKERAPLDDLVKDYIEGYSGRATDDCIVEMVKDWLFKNKTTVKG